ncbi:MAG: hypothetical protein ACJ8H8_22445 [Geminicoccaceae bacterium]
MAAEQREAQEAADRLYNEGHAALERARDIYAAYADAAADLARLVESLARLNDEILSVNRRLNERGDPRSLRDLDTALRPAVSDLQMLRYPLWTQIRLPATTGPHDWLVPAQRELRVKLPPTKVPGDALDPPAEPLPAGRVRW